MDDYEVLKGPIDHNIITINRFDGWNMVEVDLGILDVEYCCANSVKIRDFIVVECQVLKSLKFKDMRVRKAQFRGISIKQSDDHLRALRNFRASRAFLLWRRIYPFASLCSRGTAHPLSFSQTMKYYCISGVDILWL